MGGQADAPGKQSRIGYIDTISWLPRQSSIVIRVVVALFRPKAGQTSKSAIVQLALLVSCSVIHVSSWSSFWGQAHCAAIPTSAIVVHGANCVGLGDEFGQVFTCPEDIRRGQSNRATDSAGAPVDHIFQKWTIAILCNQVVETGAVTICPRPNRKGPSGRQRDTPSACGWRGAGRGGLLRIGCDSERIDLPIKIAQRIQVARLVSANAADRNADCHQKPVLPFVLSLLSQ